MHLRSGNESEILKVLFAFGGTAAGQTFSPKGSLDGSFSYCFPLSKRFTASDVSDFLAFVLLAMCIL